MNKRPKLHSSIILTYRCNAKCNMCEVWKYPTRSGEELQKEIQNAMAAVTPSHWYENNPRTVIESFALGKPVIGARIGGIPELVKDGETGLTFEPANADDLRNKIEYLIRNCDKIIEMGKNARKFVEKEFNPEKHYKKLMEVYEKAIEKHQ